ncbi:4-(cytidine 5'-diphospho)-2-C-methyl-D-erythritol kinase [Roseovarius autotrophicus]|uniref:4-(cytidine 5'-diphospho)-2-C-methyl-D-erythritol kinase n=1 Tax=Roseovarius autotrophicus TaxID=2824121 RepID=UPI001A02B32B|nr:4-(cytidine 5'-diphospho)-2-C-methyl-D-erythritol kinase [Roseovarius autotrophicus]MBE0452804.1 4-(cytidine 5'-diphospho)-2-C-methyl-D-erythritol kinase [Roseovarius sp.]
MTSEVAPAKVNLTLHVTGRGTDGYHLLDSLVGFADTGDRLDVRLADVASLRVTGPRAAGVPEGPENLVLRAAALMGVTASITLEKHLPAAAGIGGGSSDAAACLRALVRLTGKALPEVPMLGADVPVCLLARAARMRGIGEQVAPVGGLPVLDAVLVNPGVPVATPQVFARLARRDNPAMPETLPPWPDAAACIRWLGTQRNDLETPAAALCPEIVAVLARLRASEGCALARMSGSGATCFGLYPDAGAAQAAAARIAAENCGWWVAATQLS